MDTPELKNGTQAAVALIPGIANDGAVVLSVILKQRWTITPDQRVVDGGPAPIVYADELRDPEDPDHSSIIAPSDICQHKPTTDVVILGSAIAYGGQPVRELDVFVRVGPVQRTLRVFGPRVWYRGVTALTPTPPESFESQAIRWEDAFGGLDASDPNGAPSKRRATRSAVASHATVSA